MVVKVSIDWLMPTNQNQPFEKLDQNNNKNIILVSLLSFSVHFDSCTFKK